MKKLLYIFSLVFLFYSCETDQKEAVTGNGFFDLSVFVQEKLDNGVLYPTVIRTVIIEEKEEVKDLGEYDMTEALSFLNQFNINRPRWLDKYEEKQDGDILIYTALEEDLKVRSLQIKKQETKVEEIVISFLSKTLISQSDKLVRYKPDTLLSIETETDSFFGEPKKRKVTWKY